MRQESASVWWLSTWQVYSHLGDIVLRMPVRASHLQRSLTRKEDLAWKWMVPSHRARPGLNKDGNKKNHVCYSSRIREMLLPKVVGAHVMLWAPETSQAATKFGVFPARFWACFCLIFPCYILIPPLKTMNGLLCPVACWKYMKKGFR